MLVGQGGEVWHCVDPDALTWHAGARANGRSVAVCLVGCFMRSKRRLWPRGPRVPPDAQLEAASAVMAELRDRYPRAEVVGHKEAPGCATDCPGDTWAEWKGEL